jgi:hypothetical protein
MKTLNCERASELLPLYVAGDLEDSRASEVAAHLGSCAGCRALAAVFDESRSLLLEACSPPEFDADFYAGIRGAVLAEIARDRRTPSKPSLVAALFSGRRLAYAMTFALLLLACFLALPHLRRATRETPREIAHVPQDKNDPSPEKVLAVNTPSTTNHATTSMNSQPGDNRRDDSESRAPLIKVKRNAVEFRHDMKTRRDALATAGTPQRVRDEVAVAPRASLDPARVVTASGASAVESANAASQSAPEVSRIEIQTADPNIRIIWLTPRKAEEPSPNHDNHENGDRN